MSEEESTQNTSNLSELKNVDSTLDVLSECTLEGIATHIKDMKCKRTIVVSGARISVQAGIPDLRSPDVGFYHAPMDSEMETYTCDAFNKRYFSSNPEPLFRLLRDLFEDDDIEPTISHYFIALLEKNGKLLRNYTLNMDDLEKKAGVRKCRLVRINGSFYKFSCSSCKQAYSYDWVKPLILENRIPLCMRCAQLIQPDVTYYGDPIPDLFYQKMAKDFRRCELLIILGTTLSVEPIATILRNHEFNCPRLVVSDVEPYDYSAFDFFSPNNQRDVLWLGDCDAACKRLLDYLGWSEQLDILTNMKLPEQVSPPPEPEPEPVE